MRRVFERSQIKVNLLGPIASIVLVACKRGGLHMRKPIAVAFVIVLLALTASCAYAPPDRYNTQRGAAIGAGVGALLGQAIGHNTEGTLIGLAAGTIFGALVGNAVDQDYQAARDAARMDKAVIYYDRQGSAVEAIPEGFDEETNCHTVTKRIWKDGELVSETIEEVCEDSERYAPPPRIVYRPYPMFYFRYGYRPWPYYGCRPHPRHYHRPHLRGHCW